MMEEGTEEGRRFYGEKGTLPFTPSPTEASRNIAPYLIIDPPWRDYGTVYKARVGRYLEGAKDQRGGAG